MYDAEWYAWEPSRDPFCDLIGSRVAALWMDTGHTRLVFELERPHGWTKQLAWITEGDCCSHSWFQEILGVDCLLNTTIIDVGYERYDSSVIEDGDSTVIKQYKVKITTSDGYTDIIFRNRSNGYYGGSIEVSRDTSIDRSQRIEDDWSA
jgi:hypothetical protein